MKWYVNQDETVVLNNNKILLGAVWRRNQNPTDPKAKLYTVIYGTYPEVYGSARYFENLKEAKAWVENGIKNY